jgi:hypothetical protein
MQPSLLNARCMIKPPSLEQAFIKVHRNSEGEIDSDSIAQHEWDATPFLEYLRLQGLKYRECQIYSPITLTYVNGSARWHDDPGFGPVACWLLFESDPGMDGAQLITQRGPINLRTGDVCVFDANQGHAWLCNGVAIMVMVTVSPIKARPMRFTNPSPRGKDCD